MTDTPTTTTSEPELSEAEVIKNLNTEFLANAIRNNEIASIMKVKYNADPPKVPKFVPVKPLPEGVENAVREALKEGPLTFKGLNVAITEVTGYKDSSELTTIHKSLEAAGIIKVTKRFEGGMAARVELVK